MQLRANQPLAHCPAPLFLSETLIFQGPTWTPSAWDLVTLFAFFQSDLARQSQCVTGTGVQ